MRAVLQRVRSASVRVDGEVVGAVREPALLALVGVAPDDGARDVEWMARKISGLRVLRDEAGLVDLGGSVLVVSQFTVYGDARAGRRPSWSGAAPASVAEPLVAALADALSAYGLTVARGRFGAMMDVELVNDGPMTIIVDSPR